MQNHLVIAYIYYMINLSAKTLQYRPLSRSDALLDCNRKILGSVCGGVNIAHKWRNTCKSTTQTEHYAAAGGGDKSLWADN